MPLDFVADVRCFFGRRFGQLERVLHDAVHAHAREDGFLEHDFALGARKNLAADGRIFTFGVFAHHVEVDLAGLAIRERAGDAGHQAHGAQIDVLIELAAEQQQRAP